LKLELIIRSYLTSFSISRSGIYLLAVLNNGYLTSGGKDRVVNIWDVSKRVLIKQLRQENTVQAMTNLANGDLAISGNSSNYYAIII
jgi:WD40 repeat protein